MLKEIAKGKIESILTNRAKAKRFLNYLIKEIVVYSRDRLPIDAMTGKPKPDQKIPYRIGIVFDLPQEFLDMV